MKRILSLLCLFITIMNSFALTIADGKIYSISNRNDNNLFVKDNGNDVIAMGQKDDNSLWQFIPTGNANCYYVKNVATGRYAQLCPTSAENSVTMGDTPAEYVILDCSAKEGNDCFGFTSTNLNVTDFTSGCIGWNWKNDNTVQTFAAVAGTNHRSFWKITEEAYSEDVDITYLIKNNDFELTDGMIVDNTNFRGVPTSWKVWGMKGGNEYIQNPGVNKTDLLPGTSYGANGGCASSRHAEKSYWLNCTPMPDDVKLYQTIHLEAGMYRISCLLSPMGTGDENYTNLRLFAGDNACYFGSEDKYGTNLGDETNKTFMGNTITMDGSDPKMQFMELEFTLSEAADIELGIRTSNVLKNGNHATSNQGRFRTDYFRIVRFTEKHVHDYSNNGICTCEGKGKFQEPEKDGDYYLLTNAGNVEWLSNAVKNGGGAAFYAKLMNDIDFMSIENLHNPIGPSTGSKFKGVFDGQGHRIMNMIINRPEAEAQGFFGWLQGNDNTTIRNLIIDNSCSITGNNKCGGIAGASQNYKEGMTITIENVVNEADVTVSGQDAAGIVGGESGGKANYYIHNVVNKGNITSTHQDPYAGALFCYQERGRVENFLNLGTITGHLGGNIGRFNVEWTNVIDLSETAEKTQGTDNDFTQSDIINGKLAYTLGWGQFIALDAYPSPLNSHAVSYVGEAGYATLYDETTGYVLNGNVKAYTAVPNKDYPYLVLTEIENIPASTPVILEGAYYNKFAHEITPIDQANALKGTASETQADGTMYVLAKPEGKEVGFYLAEENTVIPAGKAYYQVANPSVKAFFFNGEEETAINSLTPALSEGEGAIYNMAGQKLSKLQKGINIVNGKKVLK
ncbi:MAG: hypothetical protein IKH05_02390 [Bacteroidaceae bacterium]|nr:hypothetical protein [Bacteroidaceae bacterium]